MREQPDDHAGPDDEPAGTDPGEKLLDGFYPYRRRFPVHRHLAAEGLDRQDIIDQVAAMADAEDELGDTGRVSGSLYHGGHDHYAFLTEVYGRFAHANVLQRDMYPSATKFEAEIVAMTAAMLHGEAVADHHAGEQVCGVLTSGGTESLMNPLLVYREWGRAHKGVTEPEIIIPVTAHVALDKGAHYFGMKVHHAPLTDAYVVDVDWVADHITPNTVALVGSAGNYAHGLVDPIEALSDLALEHDLGLHVDGCLGGFILPWGDRLGYPIPRFDFRVPGVTSISADTHKFGYSLKGTSVLLYRNQELRQHQYFTYPDWPGGLYLSPGMSGSRSGGLIAAAWAAMVALGEDGYLEAAEAIFSTAATLRAAVEAQPGLRVIGDPSFLVAFASDEVDIFHVNDELTTRGWRLNGLQLPPALHFCVTLPNTRPGVVEAFAEDLAAAVDYAHHPRRPEPRSGALYGLSGTPAGNEAVNAVLAGAIDAMYALPPEG
jgi:sphinganine-1-phosphate aldolase